MREYAEVARLVSAFEAGTLPRDAWTHQAHFVVGLWYLLHHDGEAALRKMRRGIIAYNEASGTPNTDTSGYHETITVFYLAALRAFIDRNRTVGDRAALFARLADDEITRKDFPLRYYSEAVLFSVTARKAWVAPDKRALPPGMARTIDTWLIPCA